jgi:hypothetical protein
MPKRASATAAAYGAPDDEDINIEFLYTTDKDRKTWAGWVEVESEPVSSFRVIQVQS